MKVVHVKLHAAVCMREEITACIGYFDGLHLGHQKLIADVVALSKAHRSKPALITFEPDPWCVIKGLSDLPHITPMPQRMRIAQSLGIEYWIILDFDKEMADLTPQAFHEQVLYPLHLHTLVCGYDFHYGQKGAGNCETLKQQSYFQVHVIDEVSSEHKKISSTRIEGLLQEGNMEEAARFMGRWYEMEGVVKGGSHVGKKNGFPTANLACNGRYVMPHKGVYIGAVKVKERWHAAMMNVGNNPTYNYQDQISIEAHILNFDADIYGEAVSFRFFHYLRPERKFADANALAQQLTQDLATTAAYFTKEKENLLCD